jgi:leucyl aminopeptidase (aminopeptidase T)
MQRTLVANYWKIRERSIKYAEILNEGKRIRLITDAGTNITLSIEGRRACADTGIYT